MMSLLAKITEIKGVIRAARKLTPASIFAWSRPAAFWIIEPERELIQVPLEVLQRKPRDLRTSMLCAFMSRWQPTAQNWC